MGRIKRSIELAKSSWEVLKADRELLWLPVMSFAASAAVFLVAAGLVFLADYDSSAGLEEFQPGTGGTIILLVALFAVGVIGVFFNAALVAGARERLTGGDPTLGSALGTASSRLHVIIPWALVAVTFGLIVRAIQNTDNPLARLLGGLLDLAWSVITFLTVPIIVVEQLGPFNALKRSTELFKQTWGENLAARIGLGIVGFLAVIPAIIVGGLFAASGVTALAILGIGAAVIWIAGVIVVMSALTAVFQAALYEYVTTGQVPVAYADADLRTTFGPRS